MSAIGTGFTTKTDAATAAAELVERAEAGLEGKPTLAILLATTQYDTESLVAGVSARLGGVPLWGGSSSTGVFQDTGWITGDGGGASLMLIADRAAGVGVPPSPTATVSRPARRPPGRLSSSLVARPASC